MIGQSGNKNTTSNAIHTSSASNNNIKTSSGIVTGRNVKKPTFSNTTNIKPSMASGIDPVRNFDRFEDVDLPFEMQRDKLIKDRENPLAGFEDLYKEAMKESKNEMMEIMMINEMIKSMVAFEIERFSKFKKDKLGEGFTADRYGTKISNWMDTLGAGKYTGNEKTDEKIQKALGIAFGELEKLVFKTATKGAVKNPYNLVELAGGNPDLGWLLSGGAEQITDTMANISEKYGGKLGQVIGKISEGWGEWVAGGAKGIGSGLRQIVPFVEKASGKILSYVGIPDAVLTFIDAIALGIDQATGQYRERNHDLGELSWMEEIPVIGNILGIGEVLTDAIDGLAGVPTDKEAIERVERKLVDGWKKLIDINDENYKKISDMEAGLEQLALNVRDVALEDRVMSEVFKVAPEFLERIRIAKGDAYELTQGDIDDLADRIQQYEDKHFGGLPTGDDMKKYISSTIKNVIRMLENEDLVQQEIIKREELFDSAPKIKASSVNMYDLRARNITDHQQATVEEMDRLKETAEQLKSLATAKDIEAFTSIINMFEGGDVMGDINSETARQEAQKARDEYNKIISEYLPLLETTAKKLNKQYSDLKKEAKKKKFKLGSSLGTIPSYSKQLISEQEVFNPIVGGYSDDGGATGGGILDDAFGTGGGGGGGCCVM